MEISCNAYANYQNTWLHQPMFIDPKTPPASDACSTAVDPDGNPIVDEAGATFADITP